MQLENKFEYQLATNNMDTLPVELLTVIATDTFELFTTLLRVNTIGTRLCEEYPQLIAKEKFIRIGTINDCTRTYLNNKLHSFNDQPACVNGIKWWYRYGKIHRAELPAIIYPNGDKRWYWNGERHRENAPAVEYASGAKFWYWNGQPHRENDLPAVDCNNIKEYWTHGARRMQS